jgi:DNA-binding LacI/PurR family transcriptional regulator
VAVQNYEYSKLLVQKLLEQGVRRPLCLSSAYSLTSEERERGFLDACREAGLPNPESLVQRVEVDRITHANYELLKEFVDDAQFDGFFAINSSLGNGLVDVLVGNPQHGATPMVGFEDFDMRNRHRFAYVAKSSVYDTGFAAGELMVCKIREKKYTLFQGSVGKQNPAFEVRFPCRIESPQARYP